MPPFETLLPFLAGIVILQLSPGPDMLLVLDRGMARGLKSAMLTIAGIVVVAGAIQVGLLVLGLGLVMRDHQSATLAIHLAGAIYLLYLGLRMMTTQLSLPPSVGSRNTLPASAIWEGALNSLANPKSFMFLFVVLPQFVDPHAGPAWSQMLCLGLLHKLASLFTLSAVALGAQRIGKWTRTRPRLLGIQRHVCGVLMTGFGISLAIRIPLSL